MFWGYCNHQSGCLEGFEMVRWDFLLYVLPSYDFGSKFHNYIPNILSSSQILVLINKTLLVTLATLVG